LRNVFFRISFLKLPHDLISHLLISQILDSKTLFSNSSETQHSWLWNIVFWFVSQWKNFQKDAPMFFLLLIIQKESIEMSFCLREEIIGAVIPPPSLPKNKYFDEASHF
jgi:hypothetical protein